MNYYNLSDADMVALLNNPRFITVLLILTVWSLIWKGVALWKAAKNGSNAWYIVMLVVNTVGILEIIYIFFFSKKKEEAVV